MKKFIIPSLLAALMTAAASVLVLASDESPRNVAFQQSQIGVTHQSTGTSRTGETRRIDLDDLGQQKYLDGETEIILSTGFGAAGQFAVGNTSNAFTVVLSSSYLQVGCRGLQDNCNTVRLASLSSKVFVQKVTWGANVIGGTGAGVNKTRVRMFDTRGTTGTNNTPLNMFFDSAGSTGTQLMVGYWCSSGTTILKDSSADIIINIGRQSR